MTTVDNAPRVTLDWSSHGPSGAAVVGPPKPCCLCAQPALLRDPTSGQPCHKVCAEAELSRRAEANSARSAAA